MSQIEQNKLAVDAILLGVAVLAKTELEQFQIRRCQVGNGDAANVPMRTVCNIPAEWEA